MNTPKATHDPELLSVVNPYDLSPIGSVSLCCWETIDKYLEIAHGLFKNHKCWLPKTKRIDVLTKTIAIMKERFDVLAFQVDSK